MADKINTVEQAVEVETNGPTGTGAVTRVGGVEVHGLTGIQMNLGVTSPNRLHLSFFALGGVKVSGLAQVEYSVRLPDPDNERESYVGTGPSLEDALARLLDDVREAKRSR